MIQMTITTTDAFLAHLESQGHHLYKLDGAWVSSDDAAVQAIIDAWVDPVPDLTPPQFEYLLALTGLDDVWAALEDGVKKKDRALLAVLRAQRRQSRFVFDVTMQFIAQFMADAVAATPGVDLSEATIKAAWVAAAAVEL